MTRVLIAAGGDQTRWNNYLGVPKWMLPIEGECLCQRILRQFRERHINDIAIIGTHPLLRKLSVPMYAPENTFQSDINKVSSGQRFWSNDTIIVFGDVWFSDLAMDVLVRRSSPDRVLMFCRFGFSTTTGGDREVFALRFSKETQRALLDGCARASIRNQHCAWWLTKYVPRIMIQIDDWTDDFDSPMAYDRWTSRRVMSPK